ncbi:MAG: hypothetical protein AAGH40_12380 [Verrucomicrobiota bacterium]
MKKLSAAALLLIPALHSAHAHPVDHDQGIAETAKHLLTSADHLTALISLVALAGLTIWVVGRKGRLSRKD